MRYSIHQKWLLAVLLLGLAFRAGLGLAEETTLDLGGDYENCGQTVQVTVSGEAVNEVKAGVFGANTSWIDGGYGIFNVETREYHPLLLDRIRQTGVTHLRLPGGIEGDYFHWQESVGDPALRLPQINCFSTNYPTFDEADGVSYVAEFGPDEWLELCELTGTALTVQLNAGNGTPQEAADFVRYCLDSGVAIESFTVGNEVCMAEERVEGITVTKTPEEYIEFYLQVWDLLGEDTREELKERQIPFGCIGIPPSHPLCKYPKWDQTVLAALNGKTDFIDIHIAYSPYFSSGQSNETIVKSLLASADWVRTLLDQEITRIEKYAPDTKIAISEYGALGAAPYSSGVAGGLFLASFFQTALAEPRMISGDYLPLTNHPDANNLVGELVNGAMGRTEDMVWDTVATYVFRMYAAQIGRDVLKTTVENAETFTASGVGLMPRIRNVAEGGAAVYYDPESGEGSLFLINKAYSENLRFDVSLPFETAELTGITELWTRNYTMCNSYTRPHLVTPIDHGDLCRTVSNGRLTVTAKPVSLLKIDFKTASAR